MTSPIEEAALKLALANAVQYGGTPDRKAVLGKIMAAFPDARARAREVIPLIEAVCARVAAMGVDAQRAELKRVAPELLVREKKERGSVLPPLPGALEGKVVMRLAPYPSGPLHIGNARMVVLNDEYVKRYRGKLLLVFDDTIGSEEKQPVPEAYDLIPQALDFLGAKVDKPYLYKHKRMDVFYRWARRVLEQGIAYVCRCPQERLRADREAGRACEHRGHEPAVNMELWEGMLAGRFAPGEAVVRLKTDAAHPNPAFRDRVLLRLSDRPHPIVGDRYRVWPMLEFSWAVDDVELGITHVLRGKDLVMEDLMERFLWDALGVEGPSFGHFGMLRIAEMKLSKSKSLKEVRSGVFTGWDDPRTWSMQALARRGIRPEAVRSFILSFGLSQNDIEVPAENLFAENRRLLDREAPRYFFVPDPQRIVVAGPREITARPPRHPDRPELGVREHRLVAGPEGIALVVGADDLATARKAGRLRLKDLGNVEVPADGPWRHIGNDLAILREKVPIIHWCPADAPAATVVNEDGAVVEGVVERAALQEPVGACVQFERFGFVRFDAMEGGRPRFIFSHK